MIGYAIGLAPGVTIHNAQQNDQCLSQTCDCRVVDDEYCAAYCKHLATVQAYEQTLPWYKTTEGETEIVVSGFVLLIAVFIFTIWWTQ